MRKSLTSLDMDELALLYILLTEGAGYAPK